MTDVPLNPATPLMIEQEMKESYLTYAMSVLVDRALPDVRDGLKPVHRRILQAMRDLNLTPGRKYLKSAKIVGDTLGNYHPHGDGSVYDAMVRMAQDFSLRYMLVDGQGNYGSIDGDSAAAYRYTEARMSPFTVEMMETSNTRRWIPARIRWSSARADGAAVQAAEPADQWLVGHRGGHGH